MPLLVSAAACCFLAVAAPAAPATSATPSQEVRIVWASRGNAAFLRSVADHVAGGLGDSTLGPRAFWQAVRRGNLPAPWTPGGAQRVGRAVHATHVLLVGRPVGTQDRAFAVQASLINVGSGRVIFTRRYSLTTALFDADSARALVTDLQEWTAVAAAVDSPSDGEGHTAVAEWDADGSAEGDPDGGNTDDDGDNRGHDYNGYDDSHPLGVPGALQLAVGAATTSRQASFASSAVSEAHPLPPCYCGGATTAFPSLYGRAGWFPHRQRLGVHGELSIGQAAIGVLTTQGQHVTTSSVMRGNAGIVYLWPLRARPVALTLMPELGYTLVRFPMGEGAFPSLTYGAPSAGVSSGVQFWKNRLSVNVGVHVMPWLQTWDEAVRLGEIDATFGWRVQGSLAVRFGALEAAVTARLEQFTLGCRGRTFLYSTTRATDVTLTDRFAQALVSVGGHFW